METKVAGIYRLTNKINGKIYIGQSRNLNKRISAHKYSKCGEKKTKICNAIGFYGWDNFKVDYLFITDDYTNINEILNTLERDFIMLYGSLNPEKGYNTDLGGNYSGRSLPWLHETKRARPIIGVSIKDSKIIKFNSSYEAALYFTNNKVCNGNIINALVGRKKSAYGYIWHYA